MIIIHELNEFCIEFNIDINNLGIILIVYRKFKDILNNKNKDFYDKLLDLQQIIEEIEDNNLGINLYFINMLFNFLIFKINKD